MHSSATTGPNNLSHLKLISCVDHLRGDNGGIWNGHRMCRGTEVGNERKDESNGKDGGFMITGGRKQKEER